jgi:hypothetical protein
MILLFEQQITFTANVDTHYKEGQEIAHAHLNG